MVMKDKLVKTGHHGSYYKMHRCLGVLSTCMFIFLGITITTYISITQTVKAQEESSSEVIESESSEMSESDSSESNESVNTAGNLLSFNI